MSRGAKNLMLGLFAFLIAGALFFGGCTRYANEEQISALEESEQTAVSSEENVDGLKQEKAELEAKKVEKQDELKNVQEEKEKIKGIVGE